MHANCIFDESINSFQSREYFEEIYCQNGIFKKMHIFLNIAPLLEVCR
jgi:hypothetical protein